MGVERSIQNLPRFCCPSVVVFYNESDSQTESEMSACFLDAGGFSIHSMGSGHCGSTKLAPDGLALLLPGNSILHSAADSVTSAVQKASQALNERGERLGRAEEKTEDMKNSAQQFAETAHKVGQPRAGVLALDCQEVIVPRNFLFQPCFWWYKM